MTSNFMGNEIALPSKLVDSSLASFFHIYIGLFRPLTSFVKVPSPPQLPDICSFLLPDLLPNSRLQGVVLSAVTHLVPCPNAAFLPAQLFVPRNSRNLPSFAPSILLLYPGPPDSRLSIVLSLRNINLTSLHIKYALIV